MTPTNTQLKQALAKMLSTEIIHHHCNLQWTPNNQYYPAWVKDTELLHLCWLVEESLTAQQKSEFLIWFWESPEYSNIWIMNHATWQQRTMALCKVKGIEIV